MICFDKIKNIYLYASSTDMRMGLPKIQTLVAFHYKPEEILHSLFIFCSSNKKTIKMYYEDEWGSWLLQNNIDLLYFFKPFNKKTIFFQFYHPFTYIIIAEKQYICSSPNAHIAT